MSKESRTGPTIQLTTESLSMDHCSTRIHLPETGQDRAWTFFKMTFPGDVAVGGKMGSGTIS